MEGLSQLSLHPSSMIKSKVFFLNILQVYWFLKQSWCLADR